jgi:hypothetical protein
VQSSDKTIKLSPWDKLDTRLFIEISIFLQTMAHTSEIINPDDVVDLLANIASDDHRKVSDWLVLAIIEKSSGKELGNISIKYFNEQMSINEISWMMLSNQEGVNAYKLSNFLKSETLKNYRLNKFIDKCLNDSGGSSHLLAQYDFIRKDEV